MIEHPKLWARARRHGSRGETAPGFSGPHETPAGVRSFLPPIVQIGLAALAGWAAVGLLFVSVVVLIEVLS